MKRKFSILTFLLFLALVLVVSTFPAISLTSGYALLNVTLRDTNTQLLISFIWNLLLISLHPPTGKVSLNVQFRDRKTSEAIILKYI
jgi:hypothetical protein